MRRAARKDANHGDIADGLRADGWTVMDLSGAGNGIPDILVGRPRTDIAPGLCVPIEIKDGSKPPSARRLTPDEERVRNNWTGPYLLVISLEDARQQLEALTK